MSCSCAKCFKIFKIFMLVVALVLGLVGLSLLIAGGVRIFKASIGSAKHDDAYGNNFEQRLSFFLDCSNAKEFSNFTATSTDYEHMKQMQCRAPQVGYTFLFVMSGVMSIFFVVAATWSGMKGGQLSSWTFSIFGGLSFAIIVAGVATMAAITAPVWKNFAWCKNFDAATVAALQGDGFVCLDQACNGNCDSAIDWMGDLGLYFSGAACALTSLMIFWILNGCCASAPKQDEASIPLFNHAASAAPVPKPASAQAGTSYQGATYV